MKLYTPLSPSEARAALDGAFPDGTYYFVDAPQPDEAHEDSVWVVADFPSEELAGREDNVDAALLGYRQFVLPGEVARRFDFVRCEFV